MLNNCHEIKLLGIVAKRIIKITVIFIVTDYIVFGKRCRIPLLQIRKTILRQ